MCFFLCCALLILLSAGRAVCQDGEAWVAQPPKPDPTIQGMAAHDGAVLMPDEPKSSVDWAHGVVSARGEGTVPADALDKSRASAMATRSAVMQARKELYSAVKSMNLDGAMTVKQFFSGNSDSEFRVSSLIRNSKISDRLTEPNGNVKVRASVDLRGKLLDALIPRSVSFQSAVYQARGPQDSYTGLIVDARGKDVKPGLLPRILDPMGREAHGPASMSRKVGLEKGVAAYVIDTAEATERVGSNPLTVTAMEIAGKTGVDIKVGPADAARIRELGSLGTVLQNARVVILVSPDAFETPAQKAARIGESLTGDDRGPVLIPLESIKNDEQ